MAVSISAAKLFICLAGGAVVGGGAVKVVERSRPQAVKVLKRPAPHLAARASMAHLAEPLPCTPMMTPTLSIGAPALGDMTANVVKGGAPARLAILPLPTILGPVAGTYVDAEMSNVSAESATASVPEPAMLGLFGFGTAAAILRRRLPRR